jgi:hypothetical protein
VRLLVQLAAKLTPEMWTETAAAHILKLFDCSDRGVRIALLQGLPVYAANLSGAMAEGILTRAVRRSAWIGVFFGLGLRLCLCV